MANDSHGKVCIALATYNGSHFIREQLVSLLDQTYEDIDIIIRDDGSKDDTLSIIEQVASENNTGKRIILKQNSRKNIGCPAGFYHIVKTSPGYDYYAFCDQDDYWLPNKVERAVMALSQVDNDIATVYCSAFDYYLPDGSFIRRSPLQPDPIPYYRTLFYTPGLGFTICFNAKARQKFIVDHNPGNEMHDRWMLRCASCMGKLIYDSTPTARHIRHDNAVTAADKHLVDLAKGFLASELRGTHTAEEVSNLRHFVDEFSGQLDFEVMRQLSVFLRKKTPCNQMRKILFPHRLRSTFLGEIAIRLMFLLAKA